MAARATLGTEEGLLLDAVLIDQYGPSDSTIALIAALHAARPALPILLLTAHGSIDLAVRAMRAGASDYLIKPIAPDRLLAALDSAVSSRSNVGELRPLSEKIKAPLGFDEIVGSAPQFRAALAIAAKAARARVPVLLEGESGVGKEVVAEAIHAASPRIKKPWVAVNCGAIPENLVESELFGHERGALPAPSSASPGVSRTPMAARSSSTKSANCRWRRRSSCCACSNPAKSSRSAPA